MSTPKVLGGQNLTANSITSLFDTLSVGAMFNLRVNNRNATDIVFDLGFSTSPSVFDNAMYLEHQLVIPANGQLELTGLAIETQHLLARSDTANVSVVAYGVEV
ncbi:MAG: hypothetical protein ACPG1A_16685 [Halioglobus sp.]